MSMPKVQVRWQCDQGHMKNMTKALCGLRLTLTGTQCS
jgi:hypothetical protein